MILVCDLPHHCRILDRNHCHAIIKFPIRWLWATPVLLVWYAVMFLFTRVSGMRMEDDRAMSKPLVGTAILAMVLSLAPPAHADTYNCRQLGATALCAQGNLNTTYGNTPSAGPAYAGGGCTSAYGTYHNCQQGHH